MSYEEAITSENANHWRKAMDCLRKNETRRLVDKPRDVKTIVVKWIYKLKDDGNYKARLVYADSNNASTREIRGAGNVIYDSII